MMQNPLHPGSILGEEVLGELGFTVAEAAARLGVSRVTLSRVIHNPRVRVSAATASDDRYFSGAAATCGVGFAHQCVPKPYCGRACDSSTTRRCTDKESEYRAA